ncbi:hypothetical protein MN116_002091 [Schistosoma mekongi]|uniref:Agrin n=1 Tax=Schistosoma mekongi TaxID=38744 RepID=A0AAE1ZJ30_SCHME|nr:hypothetical protein MN116_002091 [Schistosoma mekongi]
MTDQKEYSSWTSSLSITTIFNIIITIIIISSIYYPSLSATWLCLSREQLIALSNSKNTYRFQAEIIQLDKVTKYSTDESSGSNAFVKITKVLKQPPNKNITQLNVNELVHINQIKSTDDTTYNPFKDNKPINDDDNDEEECLPKLERGKIYEWITYTPENINNLLHTDEQKQLTLMPGGIFTLSTTSEFLTGQLKSLTSSYADSAVHNGCSKRECRFGAICEEWLSKDSGQFIGVCVCPTLMDMAKSHMCNMNSGTICTTNGLFYLNECIMLHQACLKQTELKPMNLNVFSRILSQNDCSLLVEKTSSSAASIITDNHSATKDIIQKLQLYNNSASEIFNRQSIHQTKTDDNPQHDSPQQSQLSNLPTMMEFNIIHNRNQHKCPTTLCPNELNPVCDTEGKIYANDCLLKKYSCRKFGPSKLLRIVSCNSTFLRNNKPKTELCGNGNLCFYEGKCYDPLDYYHRIKGTNIKRIIPITSNCICDEINCLNEWPDPVCADDGETYTNKCFLKRSICETQSMKRILYLGNCASNPCLHHKCSWKSEKCQVDMNGQAKCMCPEPCPVVSPVCGSDGVTYENTCHLERTACQKKKEIHVIYSGECSEPNDCVLLNQPCHGYEICSRIKNPMVYSSMNRKLDSSVYDLTSTFEDTIPQCICPTCPEHSLGGQVCGSDGQTYRSECHLRSSACQRHSVDLTVKSSGKCDACQTKQCKYYAICQLSAFGEPQCICPTDCLYVRKPVCGTDGKTYENECFLKVKSCADQREVHVAQEGYCRPCTAGCPLGYQCRNGQCICRDTCPPKHSTELDVCGTDGKIYPSECELKRQACIQQQNIEVDLTGVKCRIKNPPVLHDENGKMSGIVQADGVREPSCTCNKLGALSEECDYLGKCRCKWGVGGIKCDQCLANYWGIQNNHECIPCSCHPLGSVGASCNQATGQCNCLNGVVGRQCSMCPDGSQVTENGCNMKGQNKDVNYESDLQQNMPTATESNHTNSLNSQLSDKSNIEDNGRLFTQMTTLLVRITFPIDQPTEICMTLSINEGNGMLLHYRSPPSEQDKMILQDVHDHHFSMGISNWKVVLKYIDGSVPNRILLVYSKQNLTRHFKHTIRAGIMSGRPWIKIDEFSKTINQDVIEKWANMHSEKLPTAGGLGTIVIGRQIKLGDQSTSDVNQHIETHEDYGFSGCLHKMTIDAGSPPKHFILDLLGEANNKLAWLGIEPNLSTGFIEAPLCSSSVNKTLVLSTNDDRPISNTVESIQPLLQSDQVQRQSSLINQKVQKLSSPNQPNKCENYGISSFTTDGKYKCICQPGWQGDMCEQVVTIIPQFFGDGYIRLAGPTGKHAIKRKKLHIELIFLVTKSPGLLFFIPPKSSYHAPFIAAYLDDQNYLIVVCRTGTKQMNNENLIQLRYNEPVQLNQWNNLIIDKLPKILRVKMNDDKKQRVSLIPAQFIRMQNRLPKELTNFDLSSSPIYLGGYNFYDQSISNYLPIQHGLKGTIQRININNAEVVLAGPSPADLMNAPEERDKVSHLLEKWANVSQWQGSPCGPQYSPCQLDQPDNICRPNIKRATCACTTPLQLMHLMKGRLDEETDEVEQQACLQRKMEMSRLNSPLSSRNDGQLQYDGPNRVPSEELFNEPDEELSPGNDPTKQILINFGGLTVYKYSGLMRFTSDFNIRLRLRTNKMDGLILLMVEQPSSHHQYDISSSSILSQPVTQITTNSELVSLVLRNGRIELLLNLVSSRKKHDKLWNIDHDGNDNPEFNRFMPIQARHTVNDGEWHMIQAIWNKQWAKLLVDNHMVFVEFTGIADYNTAPVRDVYLGGTIFNILGLSADYQQNFTGCIADMLIQEKIIPILSEATEIHGPIERCRIS